MEHNSAEKSWRSYHSLHEPSWNIMNQLSIVFNSYQPCAALLRFRMVSDVVPINSLEECVLTCHEQADVAGSKKDSTLAWKSPPQKKNIKDCICIRNTIIQGRSAKEWISDQQWSIDSRLVVLARGFRCRLYSIIRYWAILFSAQLGGQLPSLVILADLELQLARNEA